jgi:spermidine/putrescine transport system substrate-binding protein
MKKKLRRLCIICAWISIIFLVLYAPKAGFWPYQDRTIHIFTWSDILHPDVIERFEKKTGIKVKFNYYSSNEELLVKLKATKGAGYDLIMPSDYALTQLIQENLLQKIDKDKLLFWPKINPRLLNHSFDPENLYSLPFEWEVYLLVFNTDYFKDHPLTPSWKMLFDKATVQYKIAMTSDPVEAALFSSFYLFGPTNALTPSQMQAVQDLLTWQKKWVGVYASFRGDYFLSTGSCQVAVASSSYMWRASQIFPSINLMNPEEGTFITIENLAIPAVSKKQDLVYKLINHLFEEESIQQHFDTFGYFPSTLHTIKDLHLPPIFENLVFASEEDFSRLHFMQEIIPQQKMTDIWVEVISSK